MPEGSAAETARKEKSKDKTEWHSREIMVQRKANTVFSDQRQVVNIHASGVVQVGAQSSESDSWLVGERAVSAGSVGKVERERWSRRKELER